MNRVRLPGGSIRLVFLTGAVVLAAVAAGGTPAVGHQATPTQTQAATDATIRDVRVNGTASDTTSAAADGGWTTGRANAANTNHINTTGPTNPITARWTFTSDAESFGAGPVVTNGTVYFATRYYGGQERGVGDGTLYAVDGWTGEERWTFTSPSGKRPNSIAVFRDTVYVGTKDGTVYALDAATGNEFWNFPAGKIVRSLTVSNRTLFVRSDERVYALGGLRGEEKWTFKTEGHPTGLAVKDGTVYATSRYGHVYALDGETGAVTWDIDIVEDVDIDNEDDVNWLNSVVVANDLVYVTHHVFNKGGSDSNFYALDAETGEARWTRTAPRADDFSDSVANGFSAPSVRGDTIYFTGKHLRAVNGMTGADRWSESSLGGSPVLLNDIGYIRKGGALYTLDPGTGAHHARFTPPPFNNKWDRFHSPMAVLNGSLYTGVGIDEPDTRYRSDHTIFYALGTPEFNYTEVSITPRSPAVNETMTATVTVRNTGTGPGTVNATLAVNGNVTNATTASLDPRTNKTVTLTHTFQQNGTYTIEIAGLTRRITVGDVAPAPTPTSTPTQDDPGSPTETALAVETATAAGSDTIPTAAATPTPTSGTAPGFGVSIAVVAGAVMVGVLGRRLWP